MFHRFRGLAVVALWQAVPIVAHEDSTGRLTIHLAGGVGRYEQVSTDCSGHVVSTRVHPFRGGGAGVQYWLTDYARVNGFATAVSSGSAAAEAVSAAESDPGGPPFDGLVGGAMLALEWRHFGIGAGVMASPDEQLVLPTPYLRTGNIDGVHARVDMVPFDGSYNMGGILRAGVASNMGHLRGTRFFAGIAMCHAGCTGEAGRAFVEYARPIANEWDVRLGAVAGRGARNFEYGLTVGGSWMPGATSPAVDAATEPVPPPAAAVTESLP